MNERNQVYLDYAATTPLDPKVLQAMMPYFLEEFGNPSSVHFWGQRAEYAVERSRELTARMIGARPDEIVFTGCGTESDNLAIRGAALAARARRGATKIVTTPVEHHAVTHTIQQLVDLEGFRIELLPVDRYGRVDPQDVAAELDANTALVSVIYANNEIGTINPIAEIGALCRRRDIPFHTDAVQAAAHLPVHVVRDYVDLLSIGAHKFYGPKGVGALYVRHGTPIFPVQTGGKQESGLRAGTQNVAYIVGLAEALRLAQEGVEERQARFVPMRDHLIERVLNEIPRVRLTGHPTERLPNHASFVFEGLDGNRLLMGLDVAGFGCSSGSACKTGDPQPSEVLTSLSLSRNWALGSLRVTMGRDTLAEDLDRFVDALKRLVESQRKIQ